jgi:hypothetical protein
MGSHLHSAEFRQRVIARHADGLSFSVVAAEFGVTKGVVAGIIGRAIKARTAERQGVRVNVAKQPKRADPPQPAPADPPPPIEEAPPVVAKDVNRYSAMPVSRRPCAFIEADLPSFVLDRDRCGAPAIVGKPYCAAHCARAFVMVNPRREPTESSRSGFVFNQGKPAR